MNKKKKMSPIVRGDELGPKLIKILGLPQNTINFSIHVPFNGAVSVECEYFPTIPAHDVDEFAELFTEFELVRVSDVATLENPENEKLSDGENQDLVRRARFALAVVGVDAHEWPDEKVISAVIRFSRLVADTLRNILGGGDEDV